MTKLWLTIGIAVATLVTSCGGSGTTIDSTPNTPSYTGVIEGYITQADIDRGTSDMTNGIPDVEVWCEEPGTGRRMGQDTTDDRGYYCIEGLPEDEELMLKFQYRQRNQVGDDPEDDDGVADDNGGNDGDDGGSDSGNGGMGEPDDGDDGADDDETCVEGELQIRLQARDRLRVDAGVCEIDEDGDGNPDDVECDNEQMQVRLRTRSRGE